MKNKGQLIDIADNFDAIPLIPRETVLFQFRCITYKILLTILSIVTEKYYRKLLSKKMGTNKCRRSENRRCVNMLKLGRIQL